MTDEQKKWIISHKSAKDLTHSVNKITYKLTWKEISEIYKYYENYQLQQKQNNKLI